MKKKEFWLSHVIAAARFSSDGLRAAFKDELAFRLVLGQACLLWTMAFFCAKDWTSAILLCLPSGICLIVELLNSAIENTVDLNSLEIHPLAKKAKDMGSAAQALAQFFLCLVWISFLFYD